MPPPKLPPKSYPERLALLAAARPNGPDCDLVTDFLWLVNARPDLAGLDVVLRNLNEAIEEARKLWPSALIESKVEWLPELLRVLLPIASAAAANTVSGASANASKTDERLSKTPDWSTRNALYDALGSSRPAGDPFYVKFRMLQAHYFFAHVAVMRKEATTAKDLYEDYGDAAEWEAIKPSPRHAGLAVRNLASCSRWADDLLMRMSLAAPPLDFAQMPTPKVRFFNRRQMLKSWTVDRPRYISNYLSQAYGLKPRFPGWGSASRALITGIGDPDDPSFDFGKWTDWDMELEGKDEGEDNTEDGPPPAPPLAGGQTAGDDAAQREAKHAEQLSADNCPDEDDQNEDSLEGWHTEDEVFQKSPGSLGGGVRSLSNQAIREAKSLAFGYEQLFPRELIGLEAGDSRAFVLLSALRDMRYTRKADAREYKNRYHQRAEAPFPIDVEAETLLFLVIMLWTGSTPERTYSLIRVESSREEVRGDLEIIKYGPTRGEGAIRVKVPFPRYRQVQEPVPDSDCDRHSYLLLPDPLHLELLTTLFGKWRRDKENPEIVFTRELSEYRSNANKLLGVWDPSGRLTISKISGTLYRRIMNRTGNDAVAAAMITGQVRRGASVPMFYACRAQERLQKVYEEAIIDLLREIDREVEGERYHVAD